MVDAMDNDETRAAPFGNTSSEFIRTQVTPEIDAYRFAKYAAPPASVPAPQRILL
ncbi:MAG: hypothetical protein ACLUFA_07010 [[Clostridium] leptum]